MGVLGPQRNTTVGRIVRAGIQGGTHQAVTDICVEIAGVPVAGCRNRIKAIASGCIEIAGIIVGPGAGVTIDAVVGAAGSDGPGIKAV